MFELWHVSLCRIWNVSLVLELLNVVVSTRGLVQMMHGRLSHLRQPGSASGGGGGMEDTSSIRRDLQLRSSRLGGCGSACCILLLVCRMEVCSSVNQLQSGGLEGWCVTIHGVVVVL